MWKTCIPLLIACSLCPATRLTAQKIDPMTLPAHHDAYRLTDRLDYKGEELFDYINGAAELYLSYGLKGMTGGKYTAEGLPQLTVEIYEMTEPRNAFGVYTQHRDREEYSHGQGSQTFADLILFWKGNHFVTVGAAKATPAASEAIRQLAARVDSLLPGGGEPPRIVHDLPRDGLVEAGYLYFHHHVWLNAYLFIADFNIVHLTDRTDALLAKYGPPDARCYLLLVEYPSADDANAAGNRLKDRYAPEWTANSPILKLEDDTWFALRLAGNKLAAIFHGSSRTQVESLYQSVYQ